MAKQFVPALESYAEKIKNEPECQRIRKAVEDTIFLLTSCQGGSVHATTIDQLINLILKRQCDDQLRKLYGNTAQIVGLGYTAVRHAKIATAACFQDREGDARQHQMDKYRNFIARSILNETGPASPCHTRLRTSSAHVLSFNYDQLFELAFFAGFADRSISGYHAYSCEVLNSGLTAFGGLEEIKKDRFCFLKLHGSAGMRCLEDPFGERILLLRDITQWKELQITDGLFFAPPGTPSVPPEPLITFPYEKDYIMSGRNNKLPFRTYVEKTWAHATHVLREATEIWVIGYSFDPTDCNYLVERLQQASKCERIVIQNRPNECDRISELLKVSYQIQSPVETVNAAF